MPATGKADPFIQCQDVIEGYLGNHRSGGEIWLEHRPTGIRVSGHLAVGMHATNRQIKAAREQLAHKLFLELNEAVVKHLRLPGRRS